MAWNKKAKRTCGRMKSSKKENWTPGKQPRHEDPPLETPVKRMQTRSSKSIATEAASVDPSTDLSMRPSTRSHRSRKSTADAASTLTVTATAINAAGDVHAATGSQRVSVTSTAIYNDGTQQAIDDSELMAAPKSIKE